MILCANKPVTVLDLASAFRMAVTGAKLDILAVRAELVRRGTNLHAWSRRFCWRSQYAQLAVRGKRGGPLARRIVETLKAELGL